jgi:hypothetical protein
VITWARFLVWLDLGIFIYWFYGRRHSPLADRAEQQARPVAVSIGDFVTMVGALALFNGVCMTLLAYMTEFGITTEITAKWHEIGVTPESADLVGLQLLGAGAALLLVGRAVARMGARRAAV